MASPEGACWAFVRAKLPQWIYGFYPIDQRWRVNLAFLLGAGGLIPMLIPSMPYKRENVLYLLFIYPIATLILLTGGHFHFASATWASVLIGLAIFAGIMLALSFGAGLLSRGSALKLAGGVAGDDHCHHAHPVDRFRADPGRDLAMGRTPGDAGGRHHRHRGVAAARHPPGTRSTVGNAGSAGVLGGLHRGVARRAADHRAVHGVGDAAAVPAGGGELRQAVALPDRGCAVLLGLYGRGGARRPAGDPQGPVRGGRCARPHLLADRWG